MIIREVILLFAVIALAASCGTSKNVTEDTVKMTVASEKRIAMGVGPMEVFLVKEGEETEWSYFYSNIDGFDYESGYEYVLEVKKEKIDDPPMDSSSIKYTLVKEVSKTQKTSENMPEDIVSRSDS